MRVKTNNQSSTQAYSKKKSSVKNVKAKTDKDNLKIIKCKHCLNPQTKTTVTFSCKHQLCGICISRLLIREDFKSLSEIQYPDRKIILVDHHLGNIRSLLENKECAEYVKIIVYVCFHCGHT